MQMTKRVLKQVTPWIVPTLLIIFWQLVVQFGGLSTRILPAPTAVVQAAIGLASSGELLRHIIASSTRALVGLLIGGSIGFISAEDLVFGRYDSPNLEHPKALLAKADAVIIATPIYKAAYTGLLKAFLDLLPQKALLGKVVLPIATGGTLAHLLAIDYALKPVLSELGARHLLGGVYAVDKQIQWLGDGKAQLDEEIDQRLKHSLHDLVEAVQAHAGVKQLALS